MSETNETYLLLYAYVDGILEKRGPYREGHLAAINAEREAGHLVVAGAYGDPVIGGALGFKDVTREHVEAFVAADPYMLAGLITSHQIHVWKLV